MGCIVHGVAKSDMTEQPALSLWASLVAQLVKNPPTMRETWVWSLGGEDPLEKGRAYALQYSGLENSMDCIVWGCKESDTTEWLSLSNLNNLEKLFCIALFLLYYQCHKSYLYIVYLLTDLWWFFNALLFYILQQIKSGVTNHNGSYTVCNFCQCSPFPEAYSL